MAKEKQKTIGIAVTIPKEKKGVKDELTKLAEKLDCSMSGLTIFALELMLKKPPTVTPEGCERKAFGAKGGGTAAGFFVVPKMSKAGKCVAVEVSEVAVRSDGAGKSFFRYKKGDEKSKATALRQAKAEAAYLMDLVGLKGPAKVTLLKAK